MSTLTYNNTVSLPEFKQRYGISTLSINLTANGKPFFKTDAGLDGKVSSKSLDSLRNKDLTDIRVSHVVEDETGKEFFLIHNVQSSQESTALVSF